jgi:hypothetical protein
VRVVERSVSRRASEVPEGKYNAALLSAMSLSDRVRPVCSVTVIITSGPIPPSGRIQNHTPFFPTSACSSDTPHTQSRVVVLVVVVVGAMVLVVVLVFVSLVVIGVLVGDRVVVAVVAVGVVLVVVSLLFCSSRREDVVLVVLVFLLVVVVLLPDVDAGLGWVLVGDKLGTQVGARV